MDRRQATVVIAGSIAGLPFIATRKAEAQSSRVARVGFLGVDPVAWKVWAEAFADRLNSLGWVDGRTVIVDYRWSQGRVDLYPALAAEFVRSRVDIIVTSGAAVPALKKAAPGIPIVFAIATDPVGEGLVSTLAHPGGQVTGIATQTPELAGKRVQLLREAMPGLQRLAVMADGNFPQAVRELSEVEAVGRKTGIDVIPLEIRRAEDIPTAFASLKRRPDALYVVINEFLNASRGRIISYAQKARLPSIYGTRDWVRSGGLMSYGPNFSDLFSRAAELVDMILKGRKPDDIPVEQPTKFELVVNRGTAKVIGVSLSQAMLDRADEVIE